MRDLHPEASVEAKARQALYDAAADLLAVCEELARDPFGISIGTHERLCAAVARARGQQ